PGSTAVPSGFVTGAPGPPADPVPVPLTARFAARTSLGSNAEPPHAVAVSSAVPSAAMISSRRGLADVAPANIEMTPRPGTLPAAVNDDSRERIIQGAIRSIARHGLERSSMA